MNSFLYLVVVLQVIGVRVTYGASLDNQAVYKIKNVQDAGLLSMKDSGSNKVFLKVDVGAASQKWRAKKPLVMRSDYELKPTSDETMDLTADDTSSLVRALPSPGNGKYWHLRTVGDGAFEVKNYATQTCLTSQGLNKQVTLSPCNNTPKQEWKFKQL